MTTDTSEKGLESPIMRHLTADLLPVALVVDSEAPVMDEDAVA